MFVQLETVIQQELEGLAMEQQQQQAPPPKMGLPSLPEPTEPPPPPPIDSPSKDDGTQEPIYESVLPRDEPNCVSPTPINVPPPPKFRSPSTERPVESPRQSRPSSRCSSSGVSAFNFLPFEKKVAPQTQ